MEDDRRELPEDFEPRYGGPEDAFRPLERSLPPPDPAPARPGQHPASVGVNVPSSRRARAAAVAQLHRQPLRRRGATGRSTWTRLAVSGAAACAALAAAATIALSGAFGGKAHNASSVASAVSSGPSSGDVYEGIDPRKEPVHVAAVPRATTARRSRPAARPVSTRQTSPASPIHFVSEYTATATTPPPQQTYTPPAAPPATSSSTPATSSSGPTTTTSHVASAGTASPATAAPTGPSGPGYVIGSNCNPKCR